MERIEIEEQLVLKPELFARAGRGGFEPERGEGAIHAFHDQVIDRTQREPGVVPPDGQTGQGIAQTAWRPAWISCGVTSPSWLASSPTTYEIAWMGMSHCPVRRPPLTEMAKYEDVLPENIQLSWSQNEICIQGAKASIRIPRKN